MSVTMSGTMSEMASGMMSEMASGMMREMASGMTREMASGMMREMASGMTRVANGFAARELGRLSACMNWEMSRVPGTKSGRETSSQRTAAAFRFAI
jgi:hypothetical protein